VARFALLGGGGRHGCTKLGEPWHGAPAPRLERLHGVTHTAAITSALTNQGVVVGDARRVDGAVQLDDAGPGNAEPEGIQALHIHHQLNVRLPLVVRVIGNVPVLVLVHLP
jgi:hypothetical protein